MVHLHGNRTCYVYSFWNDEDCMYYIGARWGKGCHPDEADYFTSSAIVKPLILANPEKWRKTILYVGRDAQKIENWLHQIFDTARDPLTYNNSPIWAENKNR